MRPIDADELMRVLGITQRCESCDGVSCLKYNQFVDACEAICEAPTIDMEDLWIACSKKLPKPEQAVIRTAKKGDGVKVVDIGLYDTNDGSILAWMPRPRPYEEKEAEYNISTQNDCNTCKDRNCKYRPDLGDPVRWNCPLWKGETK